MNLSLDNFISGFERTSRELPALLAEWDSVDEDLRAEYAEQLAWLLNARPIAIDRSMAEGRFLEIAQRMAAAASLIWEIRTDLEAKTGISARQIMPYVAYTATACNAPSSGAGLPRAVAA